MTLDEINTKVKGKVEVAVEGAAATCVYCGDLLSDIMGHAGEDYTSEAGGYGNNSGEGLTTEEGQW